MIQSLMDKKIRILIVADEVWNDNTNPRNVLSNWFDGFNAEFAEIYCSPGRPFNKCCYRYFQLTEMIMLKSIFTGQKAGRIFETYQDECKITGELPENEENKKIYALMKSIASEPVRLVRDWIWLSGKYDEEKLKHFITEFNPDIVFCPRFASRKMLRLERTIAELSGKPMVAFTGDDEYSLKQLSFSPIYWIRRLLLRRDLRKTMPVYSKYYTLSAEQMQEYNNTFNIDIDILRKCADFKDVRIKTSIGHPIKIIYAGKLYCNRWKMLSAINRALKRINKDSVKMILEIYTKDRIGTRQRKTLDDGRNSFLKGAVSEEGLTEVYRNADIALHVESLDLKNRLSTRLSFSTKIIDCLASGCAVMAVSWAQHSGYTYLKQEDSAVCVDSYNEIHTALNTLCSNPDLILNYQRKALECGMRNHRKEAVQNKLYKDFISIAGRIIS